MDTYNVDKINEMIVEITKMRESRGVKMKGGKTYTMVQDRIEALRRKCGDEYKIQTEMVHYSSEESGPIVFRAVIRDATGQTVATGHAEEIRGSSQITDTSAIEVCETSAIGRALAVLGIHGGEFASAEELAVVVGKLEKRDVAKRSAAPPPAKNVANGAPVHQTLAKVYAGAGQTASPVTGQQLDLEQAVADAGGEATGLHTAQIMQDLRQDVADMVSTIKGRTPILKPSQDMHMISECFFTFMPLCTSVEETYSFWFANESALNVLKSNDPELYDQVKQRFVDRRDELKKEVKDGQQQTVSA